MESRTNQERVVAYLSDPRSYPETTREVQTCETHISRVFLAGDHAYKLKKDVSLGFLDYSSPARRRHFCERELELNRRLAPRVYLDVIPLYDAGGDIRAGWEGARDDGEEVDCVLRMERIDDERLLESLIHAGEATSEHIERLLDVLAPFFEHAARTGAGAEYGSPELITRTVRETLAFAGAPGEGVLDAEALAVLRSRQLAFLTLEARRFRARKAEGFVRDGHGDVRAEHVAYLPECVVLDCIEFNDELRIIDVASDLAFLVMDLEFLGAADLARVLVDGYERRSGDWTFRDVLDVYVAYRACVRGKVDGIRLNQPSTPEDTRGALRERARRYYVLARRYAERLPAPALLTVGGLPGAGKSTLASCLAERLGAEWLRSDVLRKELAGLAPTSRPEGEVSEALYSSESTRRTYDELLARAERLLRVGAWVVLDATFARRQTRERLRALAAKLGLRHLHFECRLPEAEARRRLEERAAKDADPSDATVEVREKFLATYEPCDGESAVPVATTGSPEAVCERAIEALREALELE